MSDIKDIEKENTSDNIKETLDEFSDNFFALAEGLPEWDLLPPERLIHRKKKDLI